MLDALGTYPGTKIGVLHGHNITELFNVHG